MQVAFGQREEFLERSGMAYDAEHGAVGTVAAQTLAAPLAVRASEIDFAHHAFGQQRAVVRCGHFGHKFVPGRAGEAIVAALQFQIGIANAGHQQAQQRVARGPLWCRRLGN